MDGEIVCEDGVCRIVPRSDSALGGAGGGSKLFPGYAVAANGMGERSAEEMVALGAAYAERMGMRPYYMYRQKYMRGNLENVGYARPHCACVYNIDILDAQIIFSS